MTWLKHSMKVQQKLTAKKKLKDNYRISHNKQLKVGLKEYEEFDIFTCEMIETRMNEIIDKINGINDLIEADPLDSELRILDWIFY